MKFGLLVFMAVLFLPGATLSYKDTTARFTVDYPATWEKQELANLHTVAFLRPKVAGDYFQENVNIVKEDLSANPLTLIQLSDLIRKQATAMQGFGKIISKKAVTIAGHPATEMVYTMDMNPLKLRMWQTWFIQGSTAYIFTYTGVEDKFEKYLPQAKGIIASFKFY